MLGLAPHLIGIVIVLVLILLWVLNTLLYRPLLKVLDQRKQIIEGSAQDAGKAAQGLEKLQQEYEQALQTARKDAKAAFAKSHDEALSQEKEILDAASKSAEAMTDKAMTKVEKNIDAARDDLRTYSETLAREITSKILGRAFT